MLLLLAKIIDILPGLGGQLNIASMLLALGVSSTVMTLTSDYLTSDIIRVSHGNSTAFHCHVSRANEGTRVPSSVASVCDCLSVCVSVV